MTPISGLNMRLVQPGGQEKRVEEKRGGSHFLTWETTTHLGLYLPP